MQVGGDGAGLKHGQELLGVGFDHKPLPDAVEGGVFYQTQPASLWSTEPAPELVSLSVAAALPRNGKGLAPKRQKLVAGAGFEPATFRL